VKTFPSSTLRQILDEDAASVLRAPLPWEELKEATVLVTGAGGFLASSLVEALLAMRHVHGFGPRCIFGLVRNAASARRRYSDHRDRDDLQLIEGDVGDPALSLPAVDIIVHAASPATPRVYLVDPVGVIDANLRGMRAMLALARRDGAQLLFVSSGEVYGQTATVPTGETDYGYLDLETVRSCYGEAKRAAEVMGVAWAHQYGLHVGIVRPFHTYGPGVALDDGRVFADFVADVVAGRDIVMRSEGTAVRAFCYVSDAVEGFFTVLHKGRSGMAYNIGNETAALSISALADLLAGLYPEKGLSVRRELASRGMDYAPSPIDRNIPSIDRARALGWEPSIGPEEGFARMVRSYQSTPKAG
jgi:UDP-glucuronate decarboxylase